MKKATSSSRALSRFAASFALACLLAASLAGCGAARYFGQKVDLAGRFPEYESYRLLDEHPVSRLLEQPASPIAPALRAAFAQRLTEVLGERGYRAAEAGERPDVYFAFSMGPRDLSLYDDYRKLGVKTWLDLPLKGGARPPGPYSLMLEAFDGLTGNPVWLGYIDPGDLRDMPETARAALYEQGMTDLAQHFPRQIRLPVENKPLVQLIY